MVISNVVVVVRGPLEITEIGSIRECLCVYPYIFLLPFLAFLLVISISLSLSYIIPSDPITIYFPVIASTLLPITCYFLPAASVIWIRYCMDHTVLMG